MSADPKSRAGALRALILALVSTQKVRCALFAEADAALQRGEPIFTSDEELTLIAEHNTRLGYEIHLSGLLLAQVVGVTEPSELASLPQEKLAALGRGQEAGNVCPCAACMAKRRSGPGAPS